MSEKKNANAREQLSKLEKLVKRVIRKSLKNNTLDYTVQISISSLSPSTVKYSAFIRSPEKGVQPIIFSFDSFDILVKPLEESEKSFNETKVEIAFHEDRINTYKAKIEQHEARKKQLEDPEYNTEDDIPMEEVGVEN